MGGSTRTAEDAGPRRRAAGLLARYRAFAREGETRDERCGCGAPCPPPARECAACHADRAAW